MKAKYLYIISIFFLIGCNDSFLERIPKDRLSDDSFWMVEEDAKQYTASIYRYIVQPGNHMIMTDCYTDNAIPVHIHAEQGDISSGNATASNPHFKQVWGDAYKGIRRCNIFLDNISKVEMNEEDKTILIGEVEFLRAYFHTTLLKFFGGIPIVTHALELNETIPTRDSEEVVLKFIIDECDKASEKLPLSRNNSSEIGRANKGAALALKAHISYLAKEYEVALTAAKQVIDLDIYEIHESYKELFLPEFENNKEVIFDKQAMENAHDYYYTGSIIDQFFSPLMMGGWEALSPTQDLIDSYECLDGKSISTSSVYDPNNPFENRDPRLKYSILWHGSEFAGKTYSTEGTMGNGNATRTGYTMRKYINPKNAGNEHYGWTNFILFRYAEILLIYAECENEINGPNNNVYNMVNKIRQREDVSLPPLPEGLSKSQMKNAIRHERRIEFTFEGIHLFETRSWRTTEHDITKPVYGTNSNKDIVFIEQRKFNPDKDYLWGIPLTEIDLSKGALKQNSGY